MTQGVNETQALRYNADKLKYDLIDPYFLEQLAKVMTFGAKKYAPHNWKKGLWFSEILASTYRHLYAIAAGEDFDAETGIYHSAHAAANMQFLTGGYRYFPNFDDRQHSYLRQPKIVLDIDEVVCDWSQGYRDYTGNELSGNYWDSNYSIGNSLDELSKDKSFWVDYLKVKHRPDFVPHAYVSSRGVSVDWSQEWVQKNDLPCRPIIHVPWGASKLVELQKLGTDIFIDDRMENFIDAQTGGITTFLMDAPHNQHWNVGYKRIKDLKIKNIIR